MKNRKKTSSCVLILLFLALASNVATAANNLRIGGTGTALGAMRHLAAMYHRQHAYDKQIVLPSLGSGGGIRATARGRLGIGLAARPMTDAEKQLGLKQIPYARTPLIFVVAKDSPENSITTEQIRDYYQGTDSHWPDGQRCRPILRPANDSETLTLKRRQPVLTPAIDRILKVPGIHITPTDQINARVVAATPGGFGYTTLTLLLSEKPSLKALDYNGVQPSLENLEAGSYPLWIDLYIVVRPDTTPAVERFIEFVTSDTGANILRKFGSLPLRGKKRD